MRQIYPAMILAMTVAFGTQANAAPRYMPASLLGTGYADHQIAPDLWEVRGASAEPDAGRAIALYRAAVLVAADHAGQFRIVDQKIVVTSRRYGYGNPGMFVREAAHFTVRAVHSDADLAACQTRHAERCLTLSVAKIMARYGPMLGQPASVAGVSPEPMVPIVSAIRITVAAAPTVARTAPAPTPVMVAASDPEPLSPYEAGRRKALADLAARGLSRN